MHVRAACREVGISKTSYYDICMQQPALICDFQQMIERSSKQQLLMILMNETAILQKMIDDGLADTTKPLERLAIYKEMIREEERLVGKLCITDYDESAAEEILTGPVLRPGISRFAPA